MKYQTLQRRCIILLALTAFLLSTSCTHETDPILIANTHYLMTAAANDVDLGTPGEGEWLYEQREKGQTFTQYRSLNPPEGDATACIYLKPIGQFARLEDSVLELTR